MYSHIPYNLIRSRRKTVALYIKPDASVEVRAPQKMPQQGIEDFVAAHSAWIQKHLALAARNQAQKTTFTLNYGDVVFFFGEACTIRPDSEGGRRGLVKDSLFLAPGLDTAAIKPAVIQVYRETALGYLRERVDYFTARMGVAPAAVRVTGAKTRWGSCSGKKRINFSWRLIMASAQAVDYVVIHELAHLQEYNHSTRFWKLVERMQPDYKRQKQELRALQTRLAAQNWD
jgi:predicted metal-dependent hydrolase